MQQTLTILYCVSVMNRAQFIADQRLHMHWCTWLNASHLFPRPYIVTGINIRSCIDEGIYQFSVPMRCCWHQHSANILHKSQCQNIRGAEISPVRLQFKQFLAVKLLPLGSCMVQRLSSVYFHVSRRIHWLALSISCWIAWQWNLELQQYSI